MFTLQNNLFIFFIGAILYSLLEIFWRGYSHISMFLVGGICFLLLIKISVFQLPFIVKAIIGTISITLIELISGLLLNRVLKLGVWDYTNTPYNFLGQICLPYSIYWFILSMIVISFSQFLTRKSG